MSRGKRVERTPEKYKLLEKLYRENKPYILIAAKLRCSRETVKKMLKERGLE